MLSRFNHLNDRDYTAVGASDVDSIVCKGIVIGNTNT